MHATATIRVEKGCQGLAVAGAFPEESIRGQARALPSQGYLPTFLTEDLLGGASLGRPEAPPSTASSLGDLRFLDLLDHLTRRLRLLWLHPFYGR